MALLIIHHRMRINRKTINLYSSHRHLILRVHQNFTPVSTNPNTYQHISRTQTQELQMVSTLASPPDTVDRMKIMVIFLTKEVNSSNKYPAVRQAINSQAPRVNGIFPLITPTTLIFIPHTIITTRQHYRTHIMGIIKIGARWIKLC